MTCRGDAAATDWLLFGGGRTSVRFRPFFCAPGRAGTGIGCATFRRTAEGTRAVRRSGQNCKRSAGRGGASGWVGEHARAVAAFQTKREGLRSVRRFGIRKRRQRGRRGEGRSGRRQQRGRRGESRSGRLRQRSKRGEGRSDRWPQRGRRGTNRRGAGRQGPNR